MIGLHSGLVVFACGVALASCSTPSDVGSASLPGLEQKAPASAASGAVRVEAAADAVRVPVDGLPTFGSPDALVTVVAFVDHECPYSGKAARTLRVLQANYGNRLRLVVASRPLPMHVSARGAARAFLAAHEQGQGEAMNARLFADQSALDEPNLIATSQALGLDQRAFDEARNSRRVEDALARAEALATSIDARGTPTLFINGRRVVGAQPLDDIRAIIEDEASRAAAIVAGGVAPSRVYDELMAAAPSYVRRTQPTDDRVQEVALENVPMRGDPRAPVTIVVFSDFECPYCVRLERTLNEIEAAYRGKVRIAHRHAPLPMHEHARMAARAAIAAQSLGRFWEFHDVLIAHRDALDVASLTRHASTAGIDAETFAARLRDPLINVRLEQDELEAARLGVTGTPTLFVNGRRVVGAQSFATLRAVIDRGLGSAVSPRGD